MNLLFFLSALLCTRFFCGQNVSTNISENRVKFDTSYIEDFSDMVVLRGFSKNKVNALQITNTEKTHSQLYQPNPRTSLGLGFNYNWLGIDLAFQLPQSLEQQNQYGSSKSFDFQANMYLRRFSIDLSYVKYSGYYIQDINDTLSIDTLIIREDINTHNIGGNIHYIFNHKKFSYRAAYLQNEKQKRSAGTWYLGLYFFRTILDSNDGFIPEYYYQLYPDTKDLIKARSWQIGASGGYAHTFVVKHFFLTLSLSLGLGYEDLKFTDRGNTAVAGASGVTPKYQMKGAFGYNAQSLSIGIHGVNDGIFIGGFRKNDLSYRYGSVKLFVAYRFIAPKQLMLINKINPSKIFNKKNGKKISQ